MHTIPTKQQLQDALTKAFNAALGDLDEHEQRVLFRSIKLGEDAELHTGCSGCVGYFATEESLISSCYYDFPDAHHKFEETLQAELSPLGLFCEPKNHVEFCIFNE